MNEKYFEPLRRMESFTQEMFNRIIAFQEKEHPTWNTSLSFDQRIQGLPLHNLIFSNPDRNPEISGPSVANFYPLREEIQKIAHYVQQVEANSLCDLYSGNGFIGSLIGREGIKVYGINDSRCKPNQIPEFYDDSCFAYINNDLVQSQCDCIMAAWMPNGENPTPKIVKLKPKLIIYIYTEHKNEKTGVRQTGTDDMINSIPDEYLLIDQWSITRPENILHEIWPDMTPSIEETRLTRIYVNKKYHTINKANNLTIKTAYDWEIDLQMALLAIEAKKVVQSNGFQN